MAVVRSIPNSATLMKILFDHPHPFFLAHGGFQTQIEQTKAALEHIGVAVEYVRWWDTAQSGDVIHYFGRAPIAYIQMAHRQNRRVAMAELLGGPGARNAGARWLQRCMIQLARSLLPSDLSARMAWDSYREADACI